MFCTQSGFAKLGHRVPVLRTVVAWLCLKKLRSRETNKQKTSEDGSGETSTKTWRMNQASAVLIRVTKPLVYSEASTVPAKGSWLIFNHPASVSSCKGQTRQPSATIRNKQKAGMSWKFDGEYHRSFFFFSFCLNRLQPLAPFSKPNCAVFVLKVRPLHKTKQLSVSF